MTINQRASERIETFLKARIVLDDGLAKIDCVIRDMSATGAKIEVAASDKIPEKFNLEVPKKNRVYGAEIRWRYENRLGLRFLSHSDLEHSDLESGQVKMPPRADLIQENARLRATVGVLAGRLRQLGESVDLSSFDDRTPPAPEYAGRQVPPSRN